MARGKRSFGIVLLVLIFSFLATHLHAAPGGQMAMNADSNLDPNWDWRQEDYEVYWSGCEKEIPCFVQAPFYSEYTGGVAFTLDYEPEDGWVLLAGNFGSDKNHLTDPYFILYNRYTGLLRVFFLLNPLEYFTSGSVILSFDSALPNTTALLAHAESRARAADRYKKELVSYGVTDVKNGHWMYADFVTAYDPNTEKVPDSAINLRLEGVNITEVKLDKGTINLTQVVPKAGIPAESDSLGLKELKTDGKHLLGYYNTFKGYKEQFKKEVEKQKDETLKKDLTEIMGSWVYKNLPFIGAGIGLVDLFISGGRKHKQESPVPMVFSGSMTLEGTMKERKYITDFSLRTPGTIHTNENFRPLYDHPLGIFNLAVTPLLRRAHYQSGCTSTEPFFKYFDEYTIVSPMYKNTDFSVNPHAGLRLKEMKAALVFRLPKEYEANPRSLPFFSPWMNLGLYEIESSTEGKYVLRTRYIPFYLFRYTTIYAPPGTEVSVKIKAVLERIDAPEGTQPVVFIADYEPEVYTSCHYSSLNPNWSPYQWPSFPDNSPNFENGSFEIGLSYWETYGDGDGYGTVEESVSGTRSAYIARNTATNQFFGLVQRAIECEPYTTYRLSLLVKTRTNSGAVAAGLGNWGSPNTHQDFGWTGGYSDWKRISGTWTSGGNEKTLDIVLYGTPDFSGEAYFDDVLLEKVGPAPLGLAVEGPSVLGFKEMGTYFTEVTGGSGNYHYQWLQQFDGSTEWYLLGTEKDQKVRMLDRSFTLGVDVYDSQTGQEAFQTIHVDYGVAKDLYPLE